MARPYDTAAFRALPRERCAVHELLGGECAGVVARHHVHPMSLGGAESGRTVPVCARHHGYLEAIARRVYGAPRWRTCPHKHVTPEAKERCEAKLNADVLVA